MRLCINGVSVPLLVQCAVRPLVFHSLTFIIIHFTHISPDFAFQNCSLYRRDGTATQLTSADIGRANCSQFESTRGKTFHDAVNHLPVASELSGRRYGRVSILGASQDGVHTTALSLQMGPEKRGYSFVHPGSR